MRSNPLKDNMTKYPWRDATFLFSLLHNFERQSALILRHLAAKDYKMTSYESLPALLS